MGKKQGSTVKGYEMSKFLHVWKSRGLVGSKDFGNLKKIMVKNPDILDIRM